MKDAVTLTETKTQQMRQPTYNGKMASREFHGLTSHSQRSNHPDLEW